jgi:hypothetical protein
MLQVGQQLRPCARQRHAPPAQGTGRAPLGRRDIRWRAQAPAEEPGHRGGGARGVCGRAAVDGLHRERMAEATRPPCVGTQVGEPIPGEDTCDGHDDSRTVGRQGPQKGRRTGLHGAVHEEVAGLVQETDRQAAGMQLDAALRVVLLGVALHEVSSSPA